MKNISEVFQERLREMSGSTHSLDDTAAASHAESQKTIKRGVGTPPTTPTSTPLHKGKRQKHMGHIIQKLLLLQFSGSEGSFQHSKACKSSIVKCSVCNDPITTTCMFTIESLNCLTFRNKIH